MSKMLADQNTAIENEYREWRGTPNWYCIKTVLHEDGRVESEIVADEKSKLAIVIQSLDKPQDGVYETAEAITYYTYHQGYAEAARHLAAARAA
jgi:hypothetical protein